MDINVREFGVTGDGVTDDYPAIMTLINTQVERGMNGLAPDDLVFPAGRYYQKPPGGQEVTMVVHEDGLVEMIEGSSLG